MLYVLTIGKKTDEKNLHYTEVVTAGSLREVADRVNNKFPGMKIFSATNAPDEHPDEATHFDPELIITHYRDKELEIEFAEKQGWALCPHKENNAKTGRYSVGQKYLFYTYRYNDGSCSTLITQADPKETKLEIISLECMEEHEVPVEYSEDTTKGYIFKDQEGRIYHNQYPVASYGQMDTSGDSQVEETDPDDVRYGYSGLQDISKMLRLFHHYNVKQEAEKLPLNENLERNNRRVELALAEAKEKFGLRISLCNFLKDNSEKKPWLLVPKYSIVA
jgi:hypothetical protein